MTAGFFGSSEWGTREHPRRALDDGSAWVALLGSAAFLIFYARRHAEVLKKERSMLPRSERMLIVLMMIMHFGTSLVHDWHSLGVVSLYGALWACALAKLIVAFGTFTLRPGYVAVALISISSSHMLWIVDSVLLLGCVFRGTFGTNACYDLGFATYENYFGNSVRRTC